MSGAPAPGIGTTHAAVKRVLWWVLAANLAVVLAKVLVGLRAGSIAVLGDAAHSGVDALNNLVGLFAVRVAARPPDEEHPYGHAKFETLGAIAVVSFLSVTCYELVSNSVRRIVLGGVPPAVDALTLGVLGGAMVVNLSVATLEARSGARLGSVLLSADARHTAADVLVTISVLGGLGLVKLGWGSADAWLAIFVALLIARSGVEILRTTIPVLVDSRAVDAARIRAVALDTEGVRGAKAVRSRGRPGEAFAELTIEVDPDINVGEAHRIADRVERRLQREAGLSDVIAHVEPHAVEEEVRGTAARRPASQSD
ncbi:MAG: cation diffusion facilitator family transporter [Gemmatimonadota bacterium]